MDVAGVDGCPGAWLVAIATTGQSLRLQTVRVASTFKHVLEQTRHCAAIGIDIPIGLSERDRRKPDIEARRLLAPLRHSSVFPSPLRQVLVATSYRDACDISQRFHIANKKLSKQTYSILPKIREVDALMTPQLQRRVREVHPEVCFWALNGEQPLEDYKRLAAGEQQRRELLARVFAKDPSDFDVPTGAARDDIYDACAAAWTAARIAASAEQSLPDNPDVDSPGLRMEIVY
jgi:predicted RNase H-like nuclease